MNIEKDIFERDDSRLTLLWGKIINLFVLIKKDSPKPISEESIREIENMDHELKL